MPHFFFIWTERNIAHLAENGVTPEEFEEVVLSEHLLMGSRSSGRPLVDGATDEGRRLVCVYDQLTKDTILPVTAFEPRE